MRDRNLTEPIPPPGGGSPTQATPPGDHDRAASAALGPARPVGAMVPDEIGLSAFQEATPNGTPDVTQLSGSAAAGSMEEAIARNRMRQADLKAQYEAWKTLEVRRLEDDPNLPAGSFIVPTYREWLDQGLALPTKFRSPQERV